jgi:hypothetical protein
VPTATWTATGVLPTAAPTADPNGPLVILQSSAWPNPNPRFVSVLLEGAADKITLKVYTAAWVLVGRSQSGAVAPGWSRLSLPAPLAGAPRGLYYFVVQAEAQGRLSQPKTGRFFLN